MSTGGAQSRSSRSPFTLTVTVFSLLFLGLMARLFYVQIVRGEDFRVRARESLVRKERIPARRGHLKDARGKILAQNVPQAQIILSPRAFKGQTPPYASISLLARLLELTDEETRQIYADLELAKRSERAPPSVKLKRHLVGDKCPYDGARLNVIRGKLAHRLFCSVCGLHHEPIEPGKHTCSCRKKREIKVSTERPHAECKSCGRSYLLNGGACPNDGALPVGVEHNLSCPVCGRTFSDEVAVVESQLHKLPGVRIETTFRRYYPFRYHAAHTLGYMNRVSGKEYRAEPGVYGYNDFVGRRGLEKSLEKVLRGYAGENRYMKRARDPVLGESHVRDLAYTPARDGWTVHLTLNIALQREVKRAFRYYKSGAAVAIDPRTGAVLAIYSKPEFDPNVWSGRLSPEVWQRTTENPYTPLIHKAVTAYHPGSVYKVVTAAAGLEEGIITPDMTFNCPGHYDFAGRRFHCHYRLGHGPVNLVQAIKHSCDVYFYKVGEMLGIDKLAQFGERFGFGELTDVQIPERKGIVPTRDYHATETKLGWQPGFSLSTAIGQGALTATPLQVARAYAALINGGDVLKMRLVDHFADRDGHVVQRFERKIVRNLELKPEFVTLIRDGLLRVVNDPDGTASDSKLESVVIAGKTGTAEAAEWRAGAGQDLAAWLREDHAWFVTYAPAKDPQIVVVVFVEHGGSGSKMAAPIAVKIVKSWMKLGLYVPPKPSTSPPAKGAGGP